MVPPPITNDVEILRNTGLLGRRHGKNFSLGFCFTVIGELRRVLGGKWEVGRSPDFSFIDLVSWYLDELHDIYIRPSRLITLKLFSTITIYIKAIPKPQSLLSTLSIIHLSRIQYNPFPANSSPQTPVYYTDKPNLPLTSASSHKNHTNPPISDQMSSLHLTTKRTFSILTKVRTAVRNLEPHSHTVISRKVGAKPDYGRLVRHFGRGAGLWVFACPISRVPLLNFFGFSLLSFSPLASSLWWGANVVEVKDDTNRWWIDISLSQ